MKIWEVLLIVVFVVFCWAMNFVKFTENDFEPPYKGEIIHGIGIIPIISCFTCWMSFDETDANSSSLKGNDD